MRSAGYRKILLSILLTYLIHMEVQAQGVQQDQGALEDQFFLLLGNQVGQENQQVLEAQQQTHLLGPTQ